MPPAAKGAQPFGNPFSEYYCCGYVGVFSLLSSFDMLPVKRFARRMKCSHWATKG